MSAQSMIYVVDDEPAVRWSLQCLLETARYNVLTFDSGGAFIEAVPRLEAGCVLLDMRMPDLSGLDVQHWLNQNYIALPVIIISGHGNVHTAVAAMKRGATDFIEKPVDRQRLFAAIENALAGSARRSAPEEAAEAARRIVNLTPREHEVLEALASGHTTKMIAHELGISVRTVEAHRGRMLERLGTKRLAQAVRYAVLASLA
ncbi:MULTISPECIES: response regulator [Rhodomicrobium]|uniref:response regulator transcription factor n=1 Tax=Rhodomicrobium TaxID=1068 RepID=UPI000B4B91D8|nr:MULTISPECIES: response regulator [Rhodomicrobium]